jgi:hypothetical protein
VEGVVKGSKTFNTNDPSGKLAKDFTSIAVEGNGKVTFSEKNFKDAGNRLHVTLPNLALAGDNNRISKIVIQNLG